MPDDLTRILSQPTTHQDYDLMPDFSDAGPVVRFLGGLYGLGLCGVIVIPILVSLAPLIPFALIFLVGAGIDKVIGKMRRRRGHRHHVKPVAPTKLEAPSRKQTLLDDEPLWFGCDVEALSDAIAQ